MNMEVGESRIERSKWIRVISGILWFIPIYLVVNILLGAVVGGIAGAGTQSYEAGYLAGQAASIAFFQQYRLLVLLAELGLTIWLSVAGILPGTAKWKKA